VVRAKVVVSGAAPQTTLLHLLPPNAAIAQDTLETLRSFDATPAAAKINLALKGLPHFPAALDADVVRLPFAPPPPGASAAALQAPAALRGTVHFEESLEEITHAFREASHPEGRFSSKPMIEMTIPSVLDPTIAPPGHHVVTLFIQYAPYHVRPIPASTPLPARVPALLRPRSSAATRDAAKTGNGWDDPHTRDHFVHAVLRTVELHAPGFRDLVVGGELLAPPDLEAEFGLPRGNIFHGGMGLDQLFFTRPAPALARYKVLDGLYLASAGSHPGGGVIGAPGRNAAHQILRAASS
jgi:phytoene dehydrogenase-like protein